MTCACTGHALIGMPSSLSIVFTKSVHLWLPSGKQLKRQLKRQFLHLKCIYYLSKPLGKCSPQHLQAFLYWTYDIAYRCHVAVSSQCGPVQAGELKAVLMGWAKFG